MPQPPPRRVSKAAKRRARRAVERQPPTPTHIRAEGVVLRPDDREYLRRKVDMKLRKFAASIERITVRVMDVNGPRGGVDHVCRIKVVLSGLPSVVFESPGADFRAAADRALAGVGRAVRRAVQRRRMKPLRRVA